MKRVLQLGVFAIHHSHILLPSRILASPKHASTRITFLGYDPHHFCSLDTNTLTLRNEPATLCKKTCKEEHQQQHLRSFAQN